MYNLTNRHLSEPRQSSEVHSSEFRLDMPLIPAVQSG